MNVNSGVIGYGQMHRIFTAAAEAEQATYKDGCLIRPQIESNIKHQNLRIFPYPDNF